MTLVHLGKNTIVAEEIVAFRVEEPIGCVDGPNDTERLWTVVWVRSHRGMYNFTEKGDHSQKLTAALTSLQSDGISASHVLQRPPAPPTDKDLEHFQYVLDNSDLEADADDPFVRLAKWALASRSA